MNILVIGSINKDYVNYVDDFPAIGETISSKKFKIFHGGKGANQAIAISRLKTQETEVYFLGKVGKDGDSEIRHLMNNGIKTKYICKSIKPTGTANIVVSSKRRDNFIVVNHGANSDWEKKDLKIIEESIKETDYILIQLETNDFLIENSLNFAKKHNKIVFFNPAPSMKFKKKWLKYIDWLIPNKTELEDICKFKISNDKDMEKAINKIFKIGTKNLIVTLGKNGSIFVEGSENKINRVSVKRVNNIVDTTAAGDTFIGAFISKFIISKNILESINFGNKAARIAIQKEGAQNSIPWRKEVLNEKN